MRSTSRPTIVEKRIFLFPFVLFLTTLSVIESSLVTWKDSAITLEFRSKSIGKGRQRGQDWNDWLFVALIMFPIVFSFSFTKNERTRESGLVVGRLLAL